MSRLIRFLASVGVAISIASPANAGLITNVVSSDDSIAQITGVTNASYSGGGGINTGAVEIDLDVKQLHLPVQLTFTYGARGDSPVITNYSVTLRVKNSVVDASQALDFNGFDLVNTGIFSGGLTSAGLNPNVAITSNVFAAEYSGAYNITNGFRWGGLLGGGTRLAPGATATTSFVYAVTYLGNNGAGTSALNFTANPEPATLLLGSLVLAPAAWVVRRRRKAAAELESAPV